MKKYLIVAALALAFIGYDWYSKHKPRSEPFECAKLAGKWAVQNVVGKQTGIIQLKPDGTYVTLEGFSESGGSWMSPPAVEGTFECGEYGIIFKFRTPGHSAETARIALFIKKSPGSMVTSISAHSQGVEAWKRI